MPLTPPLDVPVMCGDHAFETTMSAEPLDGVRLGCPLPIRRHPFGLKPHGDSPLSVPRANSNPPICHPANPWNKMLASRSPVMDGQAMGGGHEIGVLDGR